MKFDIDGDDLIDGGHCRCCGRIVGDGAHECPVPGGARCIEAERQALQELLGREVDADEALREALAVAIGDEQ